MSFWNSETLKQRIPSELLISPYVESQVVHCAYEMLMGPEAFVTSTESKTKIDLDDGKLFVLPPGQFALLLTEESVRVPTDAIALISMKFGFKSRGLINVSGFHVDPGFDGRLKFSVYNAGSRDITITRGDRVFLIWFCSLNAETEDGRRLPRANQNTISSDDQNQMHGDIASPRQLRIELNKLEHFYANNKWLLGVLIGVVFGILIRLCFMASIFSPSHDAIIELRSRLKEELREELRIDMSVIGRQAGDGARTSAKSIAPSVSDNSTSSKNATPKNP